ncbi:MAG: SIMPL domain-containing protein [Chloroflexota bacterium]
MKKRSWPLLVLGTAVVLVSLLVVGCAAETVAGGNSPTSIVVTNPQQTGIWVTGEGKVTTTPDIAVLTLGIEAQAASVTEAQKQAQGAMNSVMSALKANGVKDKDIQTQRFSITPVTRWDEKEDKPETIGYRVSNMVVAKVRQVDDAGIVIDAVAEAGGDLTRIESISFTVDDPKALQAQAQELALKDAKEKARAIADTMGVRLGKLTYAQVSAYTPSPTPVIVREAAAGGQTPISPGEISVQATVQAAYAID